MKRATNWALAKGFTVEIGVPHAGLLSKAYFSDAYRPQVETTKMWRRRKQSRMKGAPQKEEREREKLSLLFAVLRVKRNL